MGYAPNEHVVIQTDYPDLSNQIGSLSDSVTANTNQIGILSGIIVNAKASGIKGDLYTGYKYNNTQVLNPNYTDNTTALNNLLNNVYLAGGGTVFLEPGIYMVSDTIKIPPLVRLIGSGVAATIIQWHPSFVNMAGPLIRFPYSPYSGIRDLMIYGCAPYNPTSDLHNTSAHGILIDYDTTAYSLYNGGSDGYSGYEAPNMLDIQNVSIEGFYGNGIEDHTYGAWVYNAHNLRISSCCGWGMNLTQTDNSYSHIDIFNCGKGALSLSGNNNKIHGGKWYLNGRYADGASSFASTAIITGQRNQLSHLELQDNYKNGIVLYNDVATTIKNILIDSCGFLNGGTTDTSTISYPNSTTDQVGIGIVCYGSRASNIDVTLTCYRYYKTPSKTQYKAIKLYGAKINLNGSIVAENFLNSAIDSDTYSTTNSKINVLI